MRSQGASPSSERRGERNGHDDEQVAELGHASRSEFALSALHACNGRARGRRQESAWPTTQTSAPSSSTARSSARPSSPIPRASRTARSGSWSATASGRVDPGGRSRHRDRRLARHDRARLGARRLAGDPREGDGGRHPRAHLADLARREVVGLHAGDRAALRQQPPPERRRPVRLLRARGRLPDHRQRGRGEALRDEHPLLAPAPRATRSRRRPTRAGSARRAPARATSIPTRAGPTTTSRTATPPS